MTKFVDMGKIGFNPILSFSSISNDFLRNLKAFFPVILIIGIVGVMYSSTPAHAEIFTLDSESSCLALGGIWNLFGQLQERCTMTHLIIDKNDKFKIKNAVILEVQSGFENYGILRIFEGSMLFIDGWNPAINHKGALIYVQGRIITDESALVENFGKINISKTGRTADHINNSQGGVINNHGEFVVGEANSVNKGRINNNGKLWIGDGDLTNKSSGVIDNGSEGVIFHSYSNLNNKGIINNTGSIIFTQDSKLKNHNKIINWGTISFESHNQIAHQYNYGTISNKDQLILNDYTKFINSGIINNEGSILIEKETSSFENEGGKIIGIKPINKNGICIPIGTC